MPKDKHAEAISLILNAPLEGEFLIADQPAPNPEYHYKEFGRGYEDGKLILKELQKYVHGDARTLLRQLDACLVHGWTVVDEALQRVTTADTILRRYRNAKPSLEADSGPLRGF